MRRFFLILTVGFLVAAGYVAFRAHALPWAPRIDWDILGLLWLLENSAKLGAWTFAFFLALLGLTSLRAARRLPAGREGLESEQKRLMGYLLVNPAKRRGPPARPRDDTASGE